MAACAVLSITSLSGGQTPRPSAPDSPVATTQPASTQQTPTTQPATPQVAASARPSPNLGPSTDALLHLLASDSFQERQHAAEELVRMGEEARPLIEEMLRRPEADVEASRDLNRH